MTDGHGTFVMTALSGIPNTLVHVSRQSITLGDLKGDFWH